MAVLRISKKQQNFVILDKTCLSEAELSWGAKGLHAYLMSMPDNWQVQVAHLRKCSSNGRDAVRGFLSELEGAGYIKKSLSRDQDTGKFGGYEYLVLEIPEPKETGIVPAPENPSLVDFNDLLPEPEKPLTGNPAPENPTLINNKYNNKLINKAASKEVVEAFDVNETEKAAAAFSEQKTKLIQNLPARISFINQASREDSVVGKTLTPYQHERVESLVNTVSDQGFCVTAEEIEYCLLNPQNFKGSGQDFSRKLNAIRTVILRGDWQTPAWLVLDEKSKAEVSLLSQKAAIHSTQAEITHFQRLLESSKGAARDTILDILNKAQKKMHELEATSHETG